MMRSSEGRLVLLTATTHRLHRGLAHPKRRRDAALGRSRTVVDRQERASLGSRDSDGCAASTISDAA
jgi:hypothetical protein